MGGDLSGAYFFDYSVNDRPSMSICENRQHGYRIGYIITPDGVVGLYDQRGKRPYTRLDVSRGGRCYYASWRRTFTDRYLKTLARRFAALTLTPTPGAPHDR